MPPLPRLTLRFGAPTAAGIPLRVTPPYGEPLSSTLRLPFALDQVALLVRALEAHHHPGDRTWAGGLVPDSQTSVAAALAQLGLWDGTPDEGSIADDIARRVGRMLGDLFAGDGAMRDGLAALDAATSVEGELMLAFEEPALALAALPWEAAHTGGAPVLLSSGKLLTCTRTIIFRHVRPPGRAFGAPLRVLTVSPAAWMEGQLATFQGEARQRLAEAVAAAGVAVEALPAATMAALDARLRGGPPVDILDFCGHGAVTPAGGCLVFDEPEAGRHFVAAETLAALPNLPPLVVLNACLGARVDPDEPLSNLAVALCGAGARAVVAMQFSIRAVAVARQIVPALYESLARSQSVGRAVADARRLLLTTEAAGVSWYLPTLYSADSDGQLPIPIPARPATINPFLTHRARQSPRQYFIGRAQALRRVWDVLRSRNSGASIYGPSGSGRTATLDRIADELPEQLPGAQAVRLAVYSGTRDSDLRAQIVDQLGGGSAGTYHAALRGRQVILLIDNLNEIASEGETGWKARSWLRSLTQLDTRNYSVQLVATSIDRLSEHFRADEQRRVSPLHGLLTNAQKLEPFSPAEARQFVLAHLAGTGVAWERFADLYAQPSYPEELRQRCQARWDELCASLL